MSATQIALTEFEAEINAEIAQKLDEIGTQGVEYAKEKGNYHNRTGRLRRSNKHNVSGTKMRLFNDAPYADEMEARGFDVISGAILYTEELAKKAFGK